MDLGASMTWIPPEPHPKPKDTKIRFWEAFQQTWATLAVHCMVIMVGMTLGFSAILLPQLEEAGSDIKISRSDASWLASVVSIVAPIGSLSAGPVVQWLGSKKTIRLSLIPYALGWLLISFANGLPMLLTGRLITGLATTFGNTPCIVYITEVSSPHMRSMLTATGPTLGSLGILMAYVLGWLFSWRTVALVPAAWNLICLIALATIPESPVWLVAHERFEEARRAIYWFHRVKPPANISTTPCKVNGLLKGSDVKGKGDAEDGIEDEDDDTARRRKKAEIAYALLMDEHAKKYSNSGEDTYGKSSDVVEKLLPDGSSKEVGSPVSIGNSKERRIGIAQRLTMLFTKPTGLKPLIILTTIFLFQQYAGVYITLFYAVNVFKEMGGGALDEYIASIMVGLVRFLMSLVNIWLFRRFGRRPLCLLSALGMTICMLTSGTSLYLTSIDEAAFSDSVMKFNDSLEFSNWSTPYPIQSPYSLPDTARGGVLNLNVSLYEPESSPSHRSERSLNDSSSDYSVLNNLVTGNISNDETMSSKYGKAGKESSFTSSSKDPQVPKFDSIRGNIPLETKNMSDEVAAADNSTFTRIPHASGTVKKSSVIPTVCMLLYVCVSMVGFLAIPWTITAELFPTEIRSLANSIVLSMANILLFSALQAYPFLLDLLAPHGVLWMFAAVSACGGIFFYFFLPETHGRNLAEIEKYFAEHTIYTYPCKKE
ncbi:facilitated trehalose transporter Tret1-like isoform X2 [Ischnura elegans]|uniref:facilitated trehalose transporter Tret1-like isoform X2 n=1 Tax=Ischnura elegans TaxID=197161 RepID=UPI001ED8784D|nr:facilitated trehalose transporter Tret1-like isoform X2 [Ischnura elegans]